MIQEAKFEEKYGVNVSVDPDTGEVSVTKRPRDEINEIEYSSRKKQKKNCAERKSSKKVWRKQKLEEIKKMKLQKNQDDFERFQDNVKFGETVHAPPTIRTFPRNSDSTDAKGKVYVTFTTNKCCYLYSRWSLLKMTISFTSFEYIFQKFLIDNMYFTPQMVLYNSL